MKHFFTISLCFLALSLSAQVEGWEYSFPYNPDENGDGLISVADLQGLLAVYGLNWDADTLVTAFGPELELFPNELVPAPSYWTFYIVPNEADLIMPAMLTSGLGPNPRWLIPTDRQNPLVLFGLEEFGEFNDSLLFIRLTSGFNPNVDAIGPWTGVQMYASTSGAFGQAVQRQMNILVPAFGSWWVK